MKSELSNSGIDVTVKDVEKYMNRYNEVMKGKNGEKAKENLVTFNIIVVFTFFVFILLQCVNTKTKISLKNFKFS